MNAWVRVMTSVGSLWYLSAYAVNESIPEGLWLTQAQQELAQREYHASENDQGLQAPNRAQGFRTYFDDHGIKLVTRDTEALPIAQLQLGGYGRVGDVLLPGSAAVSFAGNEVSLDWPGVTVLYSNTQGGLAQQLLFRDAPAGSTGLIVQFRVEGAEIQSSGGGLNLNSPGGNLQVDQFFALDEQGKELPLKFSADGPQLTLRVDDSKAQYPIKIQSVINGVISGELSANQAGSQFGRSVSGAGDVNGDGYTDLLIGAYQYDNGQTDEGAAFIYFGGPGGFNTTLDVQLEISQANAYFGYSVAGAGDVNGDGYADVLIGAYLFDNVQANEGAAFIYFGGPGAFDINADAQLGVGQAGARLGFSVAGAGDVNGDGYADVLIGAPLYDKGQLNEGAAFVYFGGAGAFNTTADALLEVDQASANFAYSVAGAGDVNDDGYTDLLVGAFDYDNGQTNEGAVFIYFGGTGEFNTVVDALLEANQEDGTFGYSVAGAGDVNGDGYADVLVGAPYFDNGQADEGVALIYFGNAGAFNTTADALLEANQASANFGLSVAGAGDVNGDGYSDIVVGAYLFDNAFVDEGKAFVYFGGAGVFDAEVDSTLQTNQASAFQGISVAGVGDVNGDGYADVLVGAPLYDDGQADEGAAFIYLGAASVFKTTSDGLLEANQAHTSFGFSVAGAGDVNGDGFSDVIVGAWEFDNGQTDEGVSFVYFGNEGVFNTAADAQLEINEANARFGNSVAGAGDVNGDGYADVIVGAYLHENGEVAEGAAFIYFGGAGLFDTTADAELEVNQVSARFGYSVAGAGDVNGDGFADVLVGAPFYDTGQDDAGSAFVYFGGKGVFDITADAHLESNQANAYFGNNVASAGDVNGDGFADLLIGAYAYDNGQADEGVAFIFFGSLGAFDTSADALLEANQAGASFGYSVAGAGDVNGDGYTDLLVGAPLYNNGQANEGAAFIFFGGTGNFNLVADARLEAYQGEALFGFSVAGAGDVNGDGYADVLVATPYYDNSQGNLGIALIYYGGPGPFNLALDALLKSGQASSNFGYSVAGAGDINGDGYADVLVGAPAYSNGQDDEGAAFIFYGRSQGRPVLAKQLRNGGATQVQAWNLSQQADGFMVSLQAASSSGRKHGRLQVEACPSGAAFGSLLCDSRTASGWTEIGSNGQLVSLNLAITGLANNRLYHWRARVQYAELSITKPDITAPPQPSAGPWRRLQANADVNDIRTSSPALEVLFKNGFESP